MSSPELNLESLVEAARRDDRQAYDAIARQVGERVRAILITRGFAARGGNDSDDVLQETWLRGLRLIAGVEWRGERALINWFGGIAINIAREGRARSGRRGTPEPIEESVPAGTASPSEDLRRGERYDRLRDSLRSLSPDHRRVILEARINRRPIAEIADEMGRSRAAVSQLLLRALQKLREEFGETESLTLPRRALEEEVARDD